MLWATHLNLVIPCRWEVFSIGFGRGHLAQGSCCSSIEVVVRDEAQVMIAYLNIDGIQPQHRSRGEVPIELVAPPRVQILQADPRDIVFNAKGTIWAGLTPFGILSGEQGCEAAGVLECAHVDFDLLRSLWMGWTQSPLWAWLKNGFRPRPDSSTLHQQMSKRNLALKPLSRAPRSSEKIL